MHNNYVNNDDEPTKNGDDESIVNYSASVDYQEYNTITNENNTSSDDPINNKTNNVDEEEVIEVIEVKDDDMNGDAPTNGSEDVVSPVEGAAAAAIVSPEPEELSSLPETPR